MKLTLTVYVVSFLAQKYFDDRKNAVVLRIFQTEQEALDWFGLDWDNYHHCDDELGPQDGKIFLEEQTGQINITLV